MAVIRRHHRLFNARGGQLANRSCQIVDHSVHDLAGVEREPRFAGMVDLLRANDHDLGPVDLLC